MRYFSFLLEMILEYLHRRHRNVLPTDFLWNYIFYVTRNSIVERTLCKSWSETYKSFPKVQDDSNKIKILTEEEKKSYNPKSIQELSIMQDSIMPKQNHSRTFGYILPELGLNLLQVQNSEVHLVAHTCFNFVDWSGEGLQSNFLGICNEARSWLCPLVWDFCILVCVNQQVKWTWNLIFCVRNKWIFL